MRYKGGEVIRLTKKKIIKDNNYISAICIHSIFMIAGILVTFATFMHTRKIDTNSIIGTIFCFIIFGIPFGYIMGLKRVRVYVDKLRKIKNGRYKIKTDLLVKKELLLSGADSSNDSFLLEFKKWSSVTNKVFEATHQKYSSVEENKKYYLIFIEGYTEPDGIYSVSEYELFL